MHVRAIMGFGLGALLLAALGCGGEVTIDHQVPAAVPIPQSARPLGAGEVSIRDAEGTNTKDLSARAKKELAAALAEINDPNAGAPAGRVDAAFHVTITDKRGERTVRRGRPDGEMRTVTLPTLVRTVDVRVELPVRAADGEEIVTLSVVRSYDSRRDPRVWGELALGRAADPNRVPSRETILRELLTDCVHRGADLLRRGRVSATVPLKYTFHSAGQRGLEAIKRGRYRKAAELFANALRESPGDAALIYNRAVACEADGRLRVALMGYRKAIQAGSDEHALTGARRVETVIRHREGALPSD